MLKPGNADLTVWRGGSFDTKVVFWKDTKNEVKYPVSTYAVSLIIEGGPTLTAGNGLTVANENELTVVLTTAQTAAMANLSRAHYHIEFKAGSETLIPIRGTLSFETP